MKMRMRIERVRGEVDVFSLLVFMEIWFDISIHCLRFRFVTSVEAN